MLYHYLKYKKKKSFLKSIVMGDDTFSPDFMESFISAFDIKWNLTELARSKGSCCFFHFILKLSNVHSTLLFG